MKGWGLLLGMAALAALALGGWLLVVQLGRTGVALNVRDALSGAPVWGSTVRFGRWEARGFAPGTIRLLPVLPGRRTLVAEAPGFLPASEPVAVGLGRVTKAPTLSLVGYSIPGLRGFAISVRREARGLLVRLAPVDGAGRFIREFPCLDLRVIVRVSIQVERGEVATGPAPHPPKRGALLFEGVAGWRWNAQPEASYRYRAVVRSDQLSALPAPLVVVDVLAIVPDPRRIDAQELDRLAEELQGVRDAHELSAIERRYEGRVEIYRAVAWNVANS